MSIISAAMVFCWPSREVEARALGDMLCWRGKSVQPCLPYLASVFPKLPLTFIHLVIEKKVTVDLDSKQTL